MKETVLQTSRLFIRNLAFSCTDEELAELFRPFGEISQVRILPSLSSRYAWLRRSYHDEIFI